MHTTVDGHGGNAIGPGLVLEQGQAGLEGQLGKPAGRIDPHDGRCLVDHLGPGIGLDLAGLQRSDATEHPVQAVGGTTIALAGRHRIGHGIGMGKAETIVQQDQFGQGMGLVQRQSSHRSLQEEGFQSCPWASPRLDQFDCPA